MAQQTKDEIADQVGAALDVLEACDLTKATSVLPAYQEAISILRLLHADLMVGYHERHKRARRKARKASEEESLRAPLWPMDV